MSEITIKQIAEVCHEANRAYCATMGDFSQPAWKDAPEWQRKSAVSGVKFQLPLFGPLDSCAKMSHSHWMREKVAGGWKWGAVKDPEKKLHPCLMAFESLPLEQQRKDLLFVFVVQALRRVVKLP